MSRANWLLSVGAWLVTTGFVLADEREKAIYWVLVAIFFTLQAIYWQRDAS